MIEVLYEHYNGLHLSLPYDFKGTLSFEKDFSCEFQALRNKREKIYCYTIFSDKEKGEHRLANSYFVGIDWIEENKKAIYVQPKLNKDAPQTDFLKMLFTALEDAALADNTADLFEIKWDKPSIHIEQQQDLLTPLLVVQFLGLVKQIVKKGLKKSYYKTEKNLYGKVKGKISIASTLKKNTLNNKPLHTWCRFEEFGVNGVENRLLKKALVFIQRYLVQYDHLQVGGYLVNMYNYIMPSFEAVSTEVELNEVRNGKTNAFYKEYEQALQLAKLILRKFGYNINSTAAKQVSTPPFWIDMSKLFELYVYGLIRKKYAATTTYQSKGNYGYTDFLLNTGGKKAIIDAKYKPKYQTDYDINDIRQLSAYARDKQLLLKLGVAEKDLLVTVPECIIVYPSNTFLGRTEIESIDFNNEKGIDAFTNFKKLAVRLPQVNP